MRSATACRSGTPTSVETRGGAGGEWSFFRVLPLPRYMWTPQGRHGSKLRTARMMSMPLNLSRSFSSKIGVFMHRVLVGSGRAVDVARVGVPRRGRIRVIVGDLAAADDHVVGQHAAHRFGEPAADALVRHLELLPGLGAPGPHLARAPFRRSAARQRPHRPGNRSAPGRARWCWTTAGSSTRS